MGKGDIKSKKGKQANGSFGNSRRRNETFVKTAVAEAVAEGKPAAKAKTKKSREITLLF